MFFVRYKQTFKWLLIEGYAPHTDTRGLLETEGSIQMNQL